MKVTGGMTLRGSFLKTRQLELLKYGTLLFFAPKDKRENKKIPTTNIAITVLLGFMLKIRSFNQLDDWLENGDFKNLVPKGMRL